MTEVITGGAWGGFHNLILSDAAIEKRVGRFKEK